MKNAIDLLIDKIKEKNNPTVMGLDPRYEMLPNSVKNKYGKDVKSVCGGILEFNKTLIDNTYDIIPAVKPQIAFYEMFGIDGMNCFKETCKYAKEKGMIVIADIKRGDIGSTASGYSNAYLGKTLVGDNEESFYDIDFVTVNPYLGIDGVKPFIDDCKKYNKGIFVLVKTSNKSSGELQDLELKDGKKIYEKVAELVASWGEELIGEYGYSSIGAVVGATYPIQIKELRDIMKNTFFLIPGYGAQGGKAEDIALGFKEGFGGIVNSSRGLMCAYKSDIWKDKFKDEEYGKATREEAIRMRDELNNSINKYMVQCGQKCPLTNVPDWTKEENMGKKVDCELLGKVELAEGIFKFTVRAPEIANEAKAGQFLNIKVTDGVEPFLRRPISIYNIKKDEGIVEFIFAVKGKGTDSLSKYEVGDVIDIMGPLGFGTFDVTTDYKSVAIIGGGIGIFPLYELTKELKENAGLNVYLGFRNKDLVVCDKEFEAIGLNKLVVTTDDGSYKEKGFAIDFMKKDIEEHMVDRIFACGPLPLLKAVKEYADEMNIPCQISLEERMGCGIGACLGCAVKVISGKEPRYGHVCKEGPVFDSKNVEL